MESMISLLWPEIALFITTCIVMVLGQSKFKDTRDLCPGVAAIGLVVSGFLAWYFQGVTSEAVLPNLPFYGKLVICGVGLMLLLLLAGSADRELEAQAARGVPFEPIRSTRGEFYSFLLFSLTGLMLCTSASDLIFLFLALELTSLPTYVMVSIATNRNRSMEAGVKYFFLGALGAAIFLYGFVMIYGGTGTTQFADITRIVAAQAEAGAINPLVILGVVLSLIGLGFKIAAVPMHFYTADVYQGASSSVAGFLAFVPKAAGFFAILSICGLVGWTHGTLDQSLPSGPRVLLWVMAALTMTIGNVLAIMQRSVKRMLAYSSIAHSGYMLVGVIAGPGGTAAAFERNGIAAVLFYLASYGIMTIGAFAVLACLEKKRSDGTLDEADDIDDLRGLVRTRPALGWTMVLSSMGLLGLPPLLGFLGKLPLFTSGIGASEITLVLVLGVNSAIAAYYYLRLAYVCFIDAPETTPNAPTIVEAPFPARKWAGVISMVGVVGLALFGSWLGDLALRGGKYSPPKYVQPAAQDPLAAQPLTAAAPD